VPNDRERLIAYVRRYFARHRQEEFPTVRRVARALGMRQADVETEADELPLMLTAYHTAPAQPLGDHFVEICE
jgi:NADH:ubiquinone oxidoreductase subunit E